MIYILESNGNYFISENMNDGRYIAKCSNDEREWAESWLAILLDNNLKEAYLLARKYYGL